MESSDMVLYLNGILQSEDIRTVDKLAALTVLHQQLDNDKIKSLKEECAKKAFTSTLFTLIDSGLSEENDPISLELVSMVLDVFGKLSRLQIDHMQSLLEDSVIRMLLQFLDSSGKLYKFPHATNAMMSKLCTNSHMIGKVQVASLGSEPLEYIHRHTNNKLKRYNCIPENVKVCQLYNTEAEEDVDISDLLIQHSLAWPGSFPGKVTGPADTDWKDILVTQVLDGAMFWAQVGIKCMNKVKGIQQELNSVDCQLEMKHLARAGELVAILTNVTGTLCYLRAQVLTVSVGQAEVFAVDYGYTLKVADTDIFTLPKHLTLNACGRKVSLCTLAGVSPPPVDEGLVSGALTILTNLSKQSAQFCRMLQSQDGLLSLNAFIRHCPSVPLRTGALTLLVNLPGIVKLQIEFLEIGIIPVILGIVKGYTDTGVAVTSREPDDRLLLSRCVMCLTNILYRNARAQAQFYEHGGIDVVLKLLVGIECSDSIYYMTTKLLRVFTGQANIGSVENNTAGPGAVGNNRARVKSEPQGPVNSEGSSVQQQAANTNACYSSDEEGTIMSGIEKGVSRLSANSNPKSKCADATGYVLGERTEIYDDDQREIVCETEIKNVKINKLAEHICGILNREHQGSVYCGLDAESRVVGLRLNRDEKDQFRLGMDRLMVDNIKPSLMHFEYVVETVPVLEPGTNVVIPDLYVLEIHIKTSSPATIYRVQNDFKCYYRFGNRTGTVSVQELRQILVLDEQEVYRKKLLELNHVKNRLIEEMQHYTKLG